MRNGLLTSNTSASVVTANGVIPLGNAIHGYGRIRVDGNGITIGGGGYYKFIANVSASVTGTDALTVQLYENGVPVSGAVATALPNVAGATVNLTIPWMIKKGCYPKTYSLVASDPITLVSVTTVTEGV